MKLQIDQKIPKSMSLVSVPNVTKQSNISYSFGVFGVIKTLIQPLILVCNWAERSSADQHAHAFQARVKFGPVPHQPQALIMVWRVLSVCKTFVCWPAGHVPRWLRMWRSWMAENLELNSLVQCGDGLTKNLQKPPKFASARQVFLLNLPASSF